MGWSSGTELAEAIEKAVKKAKIKLTPEQADTLGREIATAFEDHDADSLTECDGFIGDAASKMRCEEYGAPKNPAKGAEFVNKYQERYIFNGRRWLYQEPE